MQKTRRLTAIILSLCLIFGLSAQALGAGLGAITYESSLQIAEGTTLKTVEAENSSGREQAYIFEYTPNPDVIPQVVFGNKLYGKSTILQAAAFIERQGETAIGGVNGDFFTMSNGLPSGIVIVDRKLISSDAWRNAVGFFEDGTAMIGKPQLKMVLSGAGQTIGISYLNKLRTNLGFYLYTEDYSAETRSTTAGTDVVLRKSSDQPLRLGEQINLTVESINTTGKSFTISPGTMVLSLDSTASVTMPAFNVGDQLTLSVTCADTRWYSVVSALGGADMLVENGEIVSGLSAAREPRTACGIKEDGSLVFLTVDGRQTGYSVGLSLVSLAEELKARGCVTAMNLDGGGSTASAVRYPGLPSFDVINSPSDGSPRPGANYIIFLNKSAGSGAARRLYLYPYDAYALPGAKVPLTVAAADESYRSVPVPPSVSYSADGGTMDGTTFVAGTKAGVAEVRASSGGLEQGLARINIVDKIQTIKITRDSKAITSLTLEPSQTVKLSAGAYIGNRTVYGDIANLTYSVSNGVGQIAQDGTFTATGTSGVTGVITVSMGDTTASVSITVGKLPALLSGFEDNASMLTPSAGATVTPESNNAYVHNGYGSAKVEFDLEKDKLSFASLTLPSALTIGQAGYVTLWVYGDNSGVHLAADFSADVSSPLYSENVHVIDFSGWKQLVFAVPGGASQLHSLRLISPSTGYSKGTIRIDQLATSFAQAPDSTPPKISLALGGTSLPALSGGITDELAIPKINISATLDGKPVDFAYSEGGGQFNASVAAGTAAGVHRLTVTARDVAGNISRQSFDFAISGNVPQPFADMNGHWSLGYVSFLTGKGVLTGSQGKNGMVFRPENNVTRLEMAAIIARYLELDPTAYINVELPYADLETIDSWALGYVKALYAEGVMKGRQQGESIVFAPKLNITREEAVTTLGRTMEMGYLIGKTDFKDASDISPYAVLYMSMFAQNAIVSGYSDQSIKPKNNIKRSEIASIIYKLY